MNIIKQLKSTFLSALLFFTVATITTISSRTEPTPNTDKYAIAVAPLLALPSCSSPPSHHGENNTGHLLPKLHELCTALPLSSSVAFLSKQHMLRTAEPDSTITENTPNGIEKMETLNEATDWSRREMAQSEWLWLVAKRV